MFRQLNRSGGPTRRYQRLMDADSSQVERVDQELGVSLQSCYDFSPPQLKFRPTVRQLEDDPKLR